MTKWPTLLSLSKATKEDVYLMWSGLGYYQRALRLLQTAKDIVASWIHRKQRNEVLAGYDTNITLKNLNVTGKNTTLLNTYQEEEEKIKCKENDGQIETLVDYYCNANISTTRLWDVPFPRDSLKQLIEYKGIGDYTAGAILSICFGRRVEAIDGNVIRVVCRLLGIAQVPQSSQLVKIVRQFVSQWICEDDPGSFNEALMELGACICTPSTALCDLCPFASYCVANKESLSKTSNFDLRQMLHTKNSQTPSCTLCEPSYICSAPFPHIYPLKKTKLLRTERISQSVVKRIENCYAFIFYKLDPNTLDVLLTLRPKGLLGDQWGPIVLPKPSSSDDATMHQKSVFSFTDILRECFKESSHNGYFTALRFDETLSSSLLEPLNVGETLVRKTEQVASICQIEMLGSLEHVFSHITHHVTIIGVMLDQLVVFPSTETRYRWIQVGRKNKHKLVTLNLVSSYNQKIMKIFFSHIQ
jgi:adenine-specific DNA glycosylase